MQLDGFLTVQLDFNKLDSLWSWPNSKIDSRQPTGVPSTINNHHSVRTGLVLIHRWVDSHAEIIRRHIVVLVYKQDSFYFHCLCELRPPIIDGAGVCRLDCKRARVIPQSYTVTACSRMDTAPAKVRLSGDSCAVKKRRKTFSHVTITVPN